MISAILWWWRHQHPGSVKPRYQVLTTDTTDQSSMNLPRFTSLVHVPSANMEETKFMTPATRGQSRCFLEPSGLTTWFHPSLVVSWDSWSRPSRHGCQCGSVWNRSSVYCPAGGDSTGSFYRSDSTSHFITSVNIQEFMSQSLVSWIMLKLWMCLGVDTTEWLTASTVQWVQV